MAQRASAHRLCPRRGHRPSPARKLTTRPTSVSAQFQARQSVPFTLAANVPAHPKVQRQRRVRHRRRVHDRIDPVPTHHVHQTGNIEELALHDCDARVIGFAIVSIVRDDLAPARGQAPDDVATGEATAAGDEDGVHAVPCWCSIGLRRALDGPAGIGAERIVDEEVPGAILALPMHLHPVMVHLDRIAARVLASDAPL
jgi:hypothetical protein